MTRPLFSLCMPYYNNPGMLAEHAKRWAAYSPDVKARMEIVLCDDASDEPAWYQDCGIHLRLFRIEPPHVMWSQCCATNIAASKANGRWLLITDIDHVVTEDVWESLFVWVHSAQRTDPTNKAYRFSRQEVDGSDYKPHPNSWLMTRELFEKTGGHDERYRGCYVQDAAFIERVKRVAGEIPQLPYKLIRVGRETIPDASTRGAARDDVRGEAKQRHSREAARLREHFRREGTYWKDTRFSAAFHEVL